MLRQFYGGFLVSAVRVQKPVEFPQVQFLDKVMFFSTLAPFRRLPSPRCTFLLLVLLVTIRHFRARIAPHSPTLLQLSLQSSIISWADWKLMRSLQLGSDSQVIRGLHAAGEFAGRVYGSRLGGNSLLDYAVLCVAMSSGGESFSPDDAYGSPWDSVLPTKGNTLLITSSTKTLLGVFACSRTGSAAVAFFAPTTTTTSSPI